MKLKNVHFHFLQSASLKMLMRKLPRTPYPECQRNMVKMVIDGEQRLILESCSNCVFSKHHTYTLNEEHITAVTFHLFCTCLHPVVAFEHNISRSLSELTGSTVKSQKQQHRVSALKSAVISKCSQPTLLSNQCCSW